MTKPKSRRPVYSFGPRLLALLLKGARERVDIPCPDQRTMHWLQVRIHSLRSAMQAEGHPQYPIVTRARTTRSKGDTDCVLTIQPHDNQFDAILDAAGITADEHHGDLLADIDAPPFSLEDEIASIPDPYAKFK
jgi:hypothetical protein